MNPLDEIDKSVSRIPFGMAFLSILFSGSLFISVNIPLIFAVGEGKQYAGLFELLKSELFSNWNTYLQISGVLSITALVFGSFVIGLVCSSAERWLNDQVVKSRKRRDGKQRYFSIQMMRESNYQQILSWLLGNRNLRAFWEWQLFLHYLYLSLSFNFVVAFALCAILLINHLTFSEIIFLLIFLTVVMAMIIVSFRHSELMASTHYQCVDLYDKEQNAKKLADAL